MAKFFEKNKEVYFLNIHNDSNVVLIQMKTKKLSKEE